ncbi:MAG: PAS domain S-box protein [Deltaproteobacteria bacterium]|nr:PAS domain S-box protein [Deltaproteobacteria bacterium]
MYRFKSLQTRIVICFISIALFVTAGITSLTIVQARKTLRKELARNLTLIGNEAYHVVNNVFVRAFADVQMIAGNALLCSSDVPIENKRAELLRLKGILRIYEDLTILDKNGTILTSTDYNLRGSLIYRKYFLEAKKGNFSMSRVHAVPDPFKTAINFAGPLYNKHKELVGILSIQCNMDTLWDMIKHIHIGSTGYIFLIDRDNAIIASPFNDSLLLQTDAVLTDQINSRRSLLEYRNADTVPMIGAFFDRNKMTQQEKELSEEFVDWKVIAVQSDKEAFNLLDVFITRIVILATIFFVLVVVLGIRYSRTIVKPIKKLSETALRIGEGNFDQHIDIQDEDEIGQLAKSFNRMSEKLKESHDELTQEIHERKQAKEQLLFTQFSVDKAAEAIEWVRPDAKILYMNEAACKQVGYSPKEILSMHVWDMDPLFSRELWPDFWKELQQKGSMTFETQHQTKGGKRFPVEVTANVFKYANKDYIIAFVKDVTERKQTEEALRESEALFRSQFELGNIGIAITSPEKGWLRVNKRICDMFGYTKEEITKKTWAEMTYPDDLELDVVQFNRMLADKIETYEMDKRFIRKDAGIIWTHVRVSCFRNPDRTVRFAIASINDITERMHMEETVKQTQKMEAVGTLAGGIAHDFNNILGGIIGYTELAQDATAQDSTIQEYLAAILKSSTRAKDLVKQILTFSRKSQEERKPILLCPVVTEATKLLRATIPTTIEIRQNIDDTIGMVNADPTQMHQIMMNLCTNAAQAMQETGGVLDIILSPVVITPESIKKYRDISPGPFVELKISDTGTGIDSETMHRIFEPFFTTKEKGKGTGMGLAVVHGIVNDHGGDISVNSQLGKGTTFTIILPQIIAEPEKEEDEPSEIQTGNEHILFVDDEIMLMDLGKKILESLGYTVTAKNSSIEALETFQLSPDIFDMVITDQSMPHMTGYNLAKRVLEIKPALPVIVCTGYSNSITPEKAKASGIEALIYKPLSKKEIAGKIREVFNKKHS